MKEPTTEELNHMFLDYQEDLASRELHLKFPVSFSDDSLDDLITLLASLPTPDFTGK